MSQPVQAVIRSRQNNAVRTAVDTSIAVPLLVATHPAHRAVKRWAENQDLYLAGHAAAETYSVLTRLPGDLQVSPQDARRLIDSGFAGVLPLSIETATMIHQHLSELGIAGGATYDALVALAAKEHNAMLASRDSRAQPTYEMIGAALVLVLG